MQQINNYPVPASLEMAATQRTESFFVPEYSHILLHKNNTDLCGDYPFPFLEIPNGDKTSFQHILRTSALAAGMILPAPILLSKINRKIK